MSHALAHASRPLLLDLYALLRELDARVYRGPDSVLPRLGELARRAGVTLAELTPDGELDEAVAAELRALAAALSGAAEASSEAWAAAVQQLRDRYDALGHLLRQRAVDVPERRPPNRARTAFHITSALVCLALVEYVLSPWQMIAVAGIGAAWCWSMELGRKLSAQMNERLLAMFAAVSHPHERHKINSATWYSTALVLLALLFTPRTCVVALVVLGLADPAAAFVGRRWGRLRLRTGRSLEGTLTFVLVGAGAALAALAIWHMDELTWPSALAIAFGAAVPAAIVELLTRRIDDNFAIPLAAATGASLVGLAF